MKKKLIVLLAVAMVGVMALTGCGSSSSSQSTSSSSSGSSDYPKMELKLAGLDKENTAKTHDLEIFADMVTKESGGNITFKKYMNASLGKATDNLTTIADGVADVGTVCTLYTPSDLPLSQITYCVPFAPNDPKLAGELMYKISEKYPDFYNEYEKKGVVNIAWKGNEPYKLYSKKPIKTISDIKGKKLTLGGVYYVPWFQSIGGVPVTAAAADLYQTVKTGVAAGSFVYDSIYCDFKLYEVEPYVLDLGIGARNCDTICFNKAKWDSFDEKTQKLLQDCADKSMKEFQDWEADQMDSWHSTMEKNGSKFATMSDSDREAWAKKALDYKDTLKEWIKDADKAGYDGEAIMSDYLKAGEELGYEWPFDTSEYEK